jgi:hypothetical protein
MTQLTSIPFQYDRRQVAMIIRISAAYAPDFAQQAGVSAESLEQMIDGDLAPPPSVLSVLKFQEDRPGMYLWHMPLVHEAMISDLG